MALPKQKFSGDLKDLDEKLNTMIGRSENMVKRGDNRMIKAYVCQICGKEGRGLHIRSHIEANHLVGISIPCNICDQTYRTRDALRHHKSRHHTNSICLTLSVQDTAETTLINNNKMKNMLKIIKLFIQIMVISVIVIR